MVLQTNFLQNYQPVLKSSQKKKEDDEDYCKVKIEPNIATDCSSAIENYELAYEFKNGFIIISERDSLFD